MDRDRFDVLSRALGAAVTRRAGLAAALAAAVGTGPAMAAGNAGAGATRKRKCKPACGPGYACTKGTCRCASGVTCDGACCAAGQGCVDGACRACSGGIVPGADDVANGTALQAAIDAAAAGAALEIPDGVYRGDFRVARPVTLQRCGPLGAPTLMANTQDRPSLEVVGAGTVRLEGLHVTTPEDLGLGSGGIVVVPDLASGAPSDVTVVDCAIVRNLSNGISVSRSTLSVEGATMILDNVARTGGAGLHIREAQVTLRDDVEVSFNIAAPSTSGAGLGGGVLLSGAAARTPRLEIRDNATIVNNRAMAFAGEPGGNPPAPGQGGGIAIVNPDPRVAGATLDLRDARASAVIADNMADGTDDQQSDDGQIGGLFVTDPASPLLQLLGVTSKRVSDNWPLDCTEGAC